MGVRRRAVGLGLAVMVSTLALGGCDAPWSDSPDPGPGEGSGAGTGQAGNGQAAPQRVPVEDLLTALPPPACEHEPIRMVDGVVPEDALRQAHPGDPSPGYVELVKGPAGDLWTLATTMTGKPDRIVRIGCSMGGVNWPEIIALYSDADKPVAYFDLGNLRPEDGAAEHVYIVSAARQGDRVAVQWDSYEGCCTLMGTWQGTLRLEGDHLVMEDIREWGVHE